MVFQLCDDEPERVSFQDPQAKSPEVVVKAVQGSPGIWSVRVPAELARADERYNFRLFVMRDGETMLVSSGDAVDRSQIPKSPQAVTFDEKRMNLDRVVC